MPDGIYNGLPALADYRNADNALSLDLLQKEISVFKWRIPETWSKPYFLFVLYSFGRLAIVNTKNGIVLLPD